MAYDDEDRSRPLGGLGEDDRDARPLERLPGKQPVHYTRKLVPALAGTSGGLLALATPDLIDASGLVDYLKAGMLAISGALVAYGTTRLAVEKGARQAAIGTRWALPVSLGAISLVGMGLATATYGGLTKPETEGLLLEEFGRKQAAYVSERLDAAQATRRIAPAVESVRDVFDDARRCERTDNCISGGAVTGRGPVYDAVQAEAQQASAIATRIAEGGRSFDAAASRLRELQGRYGATIADETLSSSARRLAAQQVAADIAVALGELEEAAPVALATAYAESLRVPVAIPRRAEASSRLNALRAAEAAKLEGVTGTIVRHAATRPELPGRAGVSDTLARISHFLPIALIVATVELAFPLLLWLTTYFGYVGRLRRDDDPDGPGGPNLPPANTVALPRIARTRP